MRWRRRAAEKRRLPHRVQPTPVPTASPSPAPVHLTDPVAVDVVFAALNKAGLKIKANNAGSGGDSGEPVRRINATYLDWPLIVSEYSSSKALAKATRWKAGAKPAQGEPPIAFIGLNILIEWGPTTTGVRPQEAGRSRDGGSHLALGGPRSAPLADEGPHHRPGGDAGPIDRDECQQGDASAMITETRAP